MPYFDLCAFRLSTDRLLQTAMRCGLMAAVMAAGCASSSVIAPSSGLPKEPPAEPGKKALVIQIARSSPQTSAWITYSLLKGSLRMKRANSGLPPDYLEEEVQALPETVAVWKKSGASAQPSPQLEALDAAVEAGFVAEYAVTATSVPGWRLEPSQHQSLRLAAYLEWRKKNLLELRWIPQSRTSTGAEPPILGHNVTAGLPPLNPSSCASVLPELQKRIAAWESSTERAPEYLLASRSNDDFSRALLWFSTKPQLQSKALLWVSPNVGELYYRAGFCAVQLQQLGAAEKHLRRLLVVSPTSAVGYSELAQTLTLAGRYQEALAQVEVGLGMSASDCESARLLRKRGFIQFEQGELMLSRKTYLQSLQLDPSSALAKSELQLIESTLRKKGVPFDSSPQDSGAVPSTQVIVSSCH